MQIFPVAVPIAQNYLHLKTVCKIICMIQMKEIKKLTHYYLSCISRNCSFDWKYNSVTSVKNKTVLFCFRINL